MPRAPHHAFTLIEAVVSCTLIAGLGVATAQAVASLGRAAYTTMQRQQGVWLCAQFMAEMDALPYAEPPGSLAGSVPDRTAFNDIGDYHGLTLAPPTARDGTAPNGFTGWEIRVLVHPVALADLNTPVVAPTTLLRITVQAWHAGRPAAQLIRLRASAAEGALDLGGTYTPGPDSAVSTFGVMPL